MRQSFVPMLLLATVALSSSNVLPLISSDRLESIAINGQRNDNILSNKYNTRDILNTLFYTLPLRSQSQLKKLTKYMNTNTNRAESINESVKEEDHYDGEGFRKEQWHNYPRQLDRLHDYLLDYRSGDTKRSVGNNDPGSEEYAPEITQVLGDVSTNEYLYNNKKDNNDVNTNPLLILRVHLACLSDRLKNTRETKPEEWIRKELNDLKEPDDLEESLFTNEINPGPKVKREDVEEIENTEQNLSGDKKTVNKRLFSLWSRLQSLSHKGHELPHRRHLAFYGFPDAEGNGALTAETRATLMRPPGSPLRWG